MKKIPGLLGSQSGLIEMGREGIRFTLDDDPSFKVEIPYAESKVWQGDANSPHFFIANDETMTQVISFQDVSALEYLASKRVRGALDVIKNVQRFKSFQITKGFSPFLFILVVLVFFLIVLTVVPIRWLDGALSLKQEKKLGRLILNYQLQRNKKAINLDSQKVAVQKLVEYLQGPNEALHAIDFEIQVNPSSSVNAYALPGGFIIINSEILNRAESVEEVLGILSHEMAHVEKRHNLKSLVGGIGRLMGFIFAAEFLGYEASEWVVSGGPFLSLNYSRRDELEAELRSFEFLRVASVDPHGMANFLKRLEKDPDYQTSTISKKNLNFLSAHPLSSNRESVVEELLIKTPFEFERSFPVDLAQLKSAL